MKDFNELTEKQKAYLQGIHSQIERLEHTMRHLSMDFNKDSDFDLDINDYIKGNFPFSESFDDLTAKMEDWSFSVSERIYN
jgi:hypothetical protein